MEIEKQPHAAQLCCNAKTRNGGVCKSYPVNGKKRCRMHGGAKGSGAPLGNYNALKHGLYTNFAKLKFKDIDELIFRTKNTNKKLREQINHANGH